MSQGKLIIFSAPSGSGKTTIVKHLMEIEKYKLEFSVSACSRNPRVNETHSNDYYFFSVEEFKQKIHNKEFIEWEEVYPNMFYGTLKSEVERVIENGRNIVFDVDVIGGINLKSIFKDKALAIFIKPPSVEELRNRLEKRSTDSIKDINKRVDKAMEEMSYYNKFDKIVVNDNLESAFLKSEEILNDFLNV